MMLNTHEIWTKDQIKCDLHLLTNIYIFILFLVTIGLHKPSGLLDFSDYSHSTTTLSGLVVQHSAP